MARRESVRPLPIDHLDEAHQPATIAPANATAAAPAGLDGLHKWAGLYRGGAVAAVAIGILLIGEVAVFAVWPRPESAREHLELFQRNWLIGLLTLDVLGVLAYLLFIPVMLALYLALHRTAESATLIATALFFIGITVFFATNTALPVAALSAQYGGAMTSAEHASVLGAAEAMFALFNETAFLTSYVMVSAAWAAVGGVMLRSLRFGRPTAWVGILAGMAAITAVSLEHLSTQLVPLAIPIYFAAIVLLLAWVAGVAAGLWRLARQSAGEPSV